jgi:hypothetical protein
MIGYAFLDSDTRLQYRTQHYIEVENPYFWQQNKGYILQKWKFDTDDLASMFLMFRQIREIFLGAKLSPEHVVEFCNMIGFDTKQLKDVYKV